MVGVFKTSSQEKGENERQTLKPGLKGHRHRKVTPCCCCGFLCVGKTASPDFESSYCFF